ncbi:oxidoreductase [Mammaliicoccus phage vB_MscM-PMS3]|nr:oxidoreductase [Mammaliicoccus phage vB_MscM-PMS3]
MKEVNTLADLGLETELTKDVTVIFKKNNCGLCQMLLIRLETMEKDGEIETPIVIHNIENDDMDTAIQLHDLSTMPTVLRYKDGKEIDREIFQNLTPDRFEELDLGEKE